jgi:hypothetical protein
MHNAQYTFSRPTFNESIFSLLMSSNDKNKKNSKKMKKNSNKNELDLKKPLLSHIEYDEDDEEEDAATDKRLKQYNRNTITKY